MIRTIFDANRNVTKMLKVGVVLFYSLWGGTGIYLYQETGFIHFRASVAQDIVCRLL